MAEIVALAAVFGGIVGGSIVVLFFHECGNYHPIGNFVPPTAPAPPSPPPSPRKK